MIVIYRAVPTFQKFYYVTMAKVTIQYGVYLKFRLNQHENKLRDNLSHCKTMRKTMVLRRLAWKVFGKLEIGNLLSYFRIENRKSMNCSEKKS